MDRSNGYEGIAPQFLARRGSGRSTGIGVNEVRKWARTLPPGAAVIDLGCGPRGALLCVTNLRQEPYAVTLHVRICAGAVSNGRPYRDRTIDGSRDRYRTRAGHFGLLNRRSI